jgi:polysaccharide biosynthesis transport protein
MSFSQIVAILRARWPIVLSILGLALGTTLALNMLLPKRYTAAAKVMIDVKSPDPVAGMVLPGMLSPTFLATQGDIIKSGRVVERVITDLKLDQSPEMMQAWQQITEGKREAYMPWLIDRLASSLRATPARESNVIEIEYSAETPEGAALFANAFTQAYIGITADLRTEPAKAFGNSFEVLATQLRKRLLDAQAKLSDFQRDAGLMATDERLDVETDKLAQISSQITQLTAILEDAKAKKQSAKQDGADVSMEGMTNTVVANIRNDLIAQQAKLSQLEERYGDMHPNVKETKSLIVELKKRLELEYGHTSQFIGANNNMVADRLAAAKASLEVQKQKLIDLREKRSGASVLMRDVENLQRAYDVVQSRVSQSGIEVQVASTSLAVLEKAIPPNKPSSPRTVLNTVIALFLGTLLAIVVTVLVELLDQRVRTNQDIQKQLGLPLVGVLLKTENASRGILTRKVPPWVIQRGNALPSPSNS